MAAAPDGPAEGPTLKETSTWLTAHITGVAADNLWIHTQPDGRKGGYATEMHEYKTTVTNATMDGCRLSLTVEHSTAYNNAVSTRTDSYDIPLEKVNKIYLGETERLDRKTGTASEEYMPKVWGTIHIDSTSPVISRTESGTAPPVNPKDKDANAQNAAAQSDSGMNHVVQIDSDDMAYSKRVVHSLERAMVLCHAALKPEPF